MQRKRLPGCLSIMVVGLLALGGCVPKITEQQLQRLRELRAQERQLMQDIQRKESEKGRLQREIASRQAELSQCQDRKRFVQDKLARWPNVWPDYAPPSPKDTAAAPGVEMRPRKKR
ncbi:MAG: hypothetical protein RMK93_03285 [Bacteroidota bacterium]|nr:hypothetical protein [Bacteroidota bacterium]